MSSSMTFGRPNVIEIRLAAIEHNVRSLKEGSRRPEGHAYGYGAVDVARWGRLSRYRCARAGGC